MEKKIFEMPEVQVDLFKETDIMTLSPSDEGNIPNIRW